ncbi:hypothetical protein, conserved [Leishmania tarentolae]|uniref:Uncharacterized protein n=1 Tax=Leishmania tarentolae TaxID=5689 RepID=A0A640KQG6_LEITA|nr:hypothetical protein, conserved [Leishmania tarentolae]
MALITQSFADHYAALVERVPTYTELLLDLQRREVGERKALEEKCQWAFQDVLHIAAVMIADKKALGRGALAHKNRFEVELYNKQTAVWFQAAPPRKVDLPTTRTHRGFPHAAFAQLCQEERELRQWLYGVERHLREHIEEACGRAWFFLNFINDTTRSEGLSRQRLEYEEYEAFAALKQRFFLGVPADYYRNVAISRYGQTGPAIEETKDLTLEEMEEKARAALMEEEEDSLKSAYQFLQDMYDLQLFSLNHREIIHRCELEEQEQNMLFPLVLQCCREDFDILFYHVPALALHLGSSHPCLRTLCLAQSEEGVRRTAATRSRFSWIPAFDVAAMSNELGFGGKWGDIEGGVEGKTQEAEDCTDGCNDSCDSQSPPVEDTPPVDTPPSVGDAFAVRTDEESAPADEIEATPESDDVKLHVLYAYEEMEEHLPVSCAAEKAPSEPEAATADASPSKTPELELTSPSKRRAVYTNTEIFIGDPFK